MTMRVILFGATGMVGQGVLRECLLDADVEQVLVVARKATGVQHPKVREILDEVQWKDAATGFDACFFCLGVSSAGMAEADYERVTYGITISAAEALAGLNPEMTFVYVSGAGTDSSEKGTTMWARVKGKTENAVLRLFKNGYAFRPGVIQPLHGARSKTASYRVLYTMTRPILPLLRWMFPAHILTTEQMGRAMLNVARRGAPKRILETKDIAAASKS
jgi:uncharacterized protein YbjT (DUF2867 family)